MVLNNGKVLVTGGLTSNYSVVSEYGLYDPSTGNWMNAGYTNIARYLHTLSLLPDGKVLITGGISKETIPADAELYDPITKVRTPTDIMQDGRCGHTASILPNEKVLVAGGSIYPVHYLIHVNYMIHLQENGQGLVV
jgi:hypothetical protein